MPLSFDSNCSVLSGLSSACHPPLVVRASAFGFHFSCHLWWHMCPLLLWLFRRVGARTFSPILFPFHGQVVPTLDNDHPGQYPLLFYVFSLTLPLKLVPSFEGTTHPMLFPSPIPKHISRSKNTSSLWFRTAMNKDLSTGPVSLSLVLQQHFKCTVQ